MKKLIILLLTMSIFTLISGIGAAKEISVNPTDSIKVAVNTAGPGDVVIVKPGIYNENIRITTQNLSIRSESGDPANTIIRTNSTTGVSVAASNTTISGFKVESGETGIYLVGCSGCIITNNDLSGNKLGISLDISSYSNISGNKADSNRLHGVQLISSDGNTIINNSVSSNIRGINSITSNKNIISGNKILNNSAFGMWISQSHDNYISWNTVNECGSNSIGTGGIHLNSSSRNIISGNTVTYNLGPGFFECPGCHNNLVYNNYIRNAHNANIKTSDTTWNITRTRGTNIIGGPYLGGNFWATPTETGFSETAPDKDEDGIADIPYSASQINIMDYLPLVSGFGGQLPVIPVANFSTNVTSGDAPLSVQFTDFSQYATGITWDFEDDGTIDSVEKNPVHVYMTPGNYTAKLKVSNENGTDTKNVIITAEEFKVKPFADFKASTLEGFSPLTVEFTDLSLDATSISWDTNGDGTQDSSNKSFVYVYSAPGIYNASLTASNKNGTDTKNVTITVQEFKVRPVANFNTNVTGGHAPLSVLFTDLSENATSRSWDFTSDGTADSNTSQIVYVYSTPKTYIVNLTVSNQNGTNSKLGTITVTKKDNPGGGSGGGGGSPEPAKNIQVKEISQAQVINGKNVKFDFTKNATCVVYVSFDAKKNAGKTTTIAEQLKGKSTLVSNLSSGEVYKYFNLWVGNSGFATSKNIENPVVCFKVEKSWMHDKKINQDSITLNRYSNKKWSQIPVKLLEEDNKYLYFTAETPEFSFFAITGKTAEEEAETETKAATSTLKLELNNTTAAETGHEQKTELGNLTGKPGSGQGGISSISGFEVLYAILCLIVVFQNKRK